MVWPPVVCAFLCHCRRSFCVTLTISATCMLRFICWLTYMLNSPELAPSCHLAGTSIRGVVETTPPFLWPSKPCFASTGPLGDPASGLAPAASAVRLYGAHPPFACKTSIVLLGVSLGGPSTSRHRRCSPTADTGPLLCGPASP